MGIIIISGSIRGEVGLRLKNEVVILSRKKISYKDHEGCKTLKL